MYNSKLGGCLGLVLLGAVTACGGTVSLLPGQDDTPSSGKSAGGSSGTKTPPSVGGVAEARGGTTSQATDPVTEGGATDKPGQGGASLPSSGCGLPLPQEQVSTIPGTRTGYTEWNVTLKGETLGTDEPRDALPRQFFVRVPVDYDPNRPYRVVYLGSGCGSQHAGKTNTFALFNEAQGGSEQAIYVGLSIPDNDVNPGCYDNNTGPQSQEWEAFEAIHTFVESHYCVDNDQIYVGGYSTGAWLANLWGCYFGGVPTPPRKFSPHWAIRGALSVTGSLAPNVPKPCGGPAAHLWIHDALDMSNLISTNTAALELALQTNGCTGNYDGPKQPWAPAEAIPELAGGICQEYTGCPAAVAARYPLVFCTTTGYGHADQANHAIPAFERFFEQLAPPQ